MVRYTPAPPALDLRYALIVALHRADEPLALQEMVDRLRSWGLEPGRPWHEPGPTDDAAARKIVSDALRWEIAKGRVRKVRRGVYGAGERPPSTTWRRIERAVAARRQGLEWWKDQAGRRHLSIDGWPG